MKHIHKVLLACFVILLSANISFSSPVELHFFIATVNLNNVSLEWGTFTEVMNMGFHVQRKKADSTFWTEIGFVVGYGTTNEPHNYSFKDIGLSNGSYNYRLKQEDFNGMFEYYELGSVVIIKTISISNISNFTPDKFILYQNYPNPFNPNTVINYELRATSYISLKVYNALGNEVTTLINEKQNAGSYSVTFDATGLVSGMYFYKIESEGFSQVKKMILLK